MDITPCVVEKQPMTIQLQTTKEGLYIFNYDTDTYLHPVNGSYFAIGLIATDPSLGSS